jgi:integrase
LVLIRQLVNFAIGRNLLVADPLKGLKLGKAPSASQPWWTRPQVEAILAKTLPRYRPYFVFLAETGARSGEAIWLRWEDIDFDANVVQIRAKEDWRPKTGDERAVPMSPALQAALCRLSKSSGWVFTSPPSAKRPVTGRQIDGRRALSHLKNVLKKLGLPGHQHTFRHSFISNSLTAGVPQAVVRQWVGHVDDRIIRTYTHIADSVSQEQMQRLGSVQQTTLQRTT